MSRSRWIGRGDESADEWVRDLQRIENIGALAYGVVHDCNDLLTVILGTAELIRADALAGGTGAEAILGDLDQITAAADRGGKLTREFLRLSASLAPAFRPVDLVRVVTEAAQVLSAALPARIELGVAAPEPVPAVRGDPPQLRSMIVNLLLAARVAIGVRAGVIEVEVESVDLDPDAAGLFRDATPLAAGPHVVVSVTADARSPERPANELAMIISIARRHGAGIRIGIDRTTPVHYQAAFPVPPPEPGP